MEGKKLGPQIVNGTVQIRCEKLLIEVKTYINYLGNTKRYQIKGLKMAFRAIEDYFTEAERKC
jgi:hypothetical protein